MREYCFGLSPNRLARLQLAFEAVPSGQLLWRLPPCWREAPGGVAALCMRWNPGGGGGGAGSLPRSVIARASACSLARKGRPQRRDEPRPRDGRRKHRDMREQNRGARRGAVAAGSIPRGKRTGHGALGVSHLNYATPSRGTRSTTHRAAGSMPRSVNQLTGDCCRWHPEKPRSGFPFDQSSVSATEISKKQMQHHEKLNSVVYAYVPVTVSTRILQMIWLQ